MRAFSSVQNAIAVNNNWIVGAEQQVLNTVILKALNTHELPNRFGDYNHTFVPLFVNRLYTEKEIIF